MSYTTVSPKDSEQENSDPFLEQHEEYIKQVSESGVPLWILDLYWYQ